jgi:hypothetical protein
MVTQPTGSQDGADKQSGGGWVEALRAISGLLAVLLGLAALTLIALFGMGFVKTDNPSVVSIAAASFGVIGTVVGAYFGSKASNDSTQKAIESTQKAIDGMKDESAKAQSFAANLDPKQASDAIDQYQRLRAEPEKTE